MLLPPSQQRPWLIATIEGDHNAYDLTTKEEIAKALNSVELEQDKNEEKQKLDPPLETQIGSFSAGEGKWGGCLRLISPSPPEILQTIPFGPDEVPTSITVCQFLEYPQHPALVVGVVTALNLKSRRCQIGHLRVYVYDQKGQLSLYHEVGNVVSSQHLFSDSSRGHSPGFVSLVRTTVGSHRPQNQTVYIREEKTT